MYSKFDSKAHAMRSIRSYGSSHEGRTSESNILDLRSNRNIPKGKSEYSSWFETHTEKISKRYLNRIEETTCCQLVNHMMVP